MPAANAGGIRASPVSLSLRASIPQGSYAYPARMLSLTPAQFTQVCAAKPQAVLALDADGTLMEGLSARGFTSARNPQA